MIRKVHIQNFKSLADFEMELGRVNVIIGANGSGKTNILEGIAMGAAAAADRLDYEFLGSRIRVTAPEFMRGAFVGKKTKLIEISFSAEEIPDELSFRLTSDKKEPRRWFDMVRGKIEETLWTAIDELLTGDGNKLDQLPKEDHWVMGMVARMKQLGDSSQLNEHFYSGALASLISATYYSTALPDFLIFSPENTILRRFEEPSQITPLGTRGEGLFYELKRIFSDKRKNKQQTEIKENLELFEWFEDISIPSGLLSMEYKIAIKDRFLDSKLADFDQRRRRGIPLVLFYLVLLTRKILPNSLRSRISIRPSTRRCARKSWP